MKNKPSEPNGGKVKSLKELPDVIRSLAAVGFGISVTFGARFFGWGWTWGVIACVFLAGFCIYHYLMNREV